MNKKIKENRWLRRILVFGGSLLPTVAMVSFLIGYNPSREDLESAAGIQQPKPRYTACLTDAGLENIKRQAGYVTGLEESANTVMDVRPRESGPEPKPKNKQKIKPVSNIGAEHYLDRGNSRETFARVELSGRAVYLDEQILKNGHFTWAEATKNGTRIPQNEETVDNIVKIARSMEDIRAYFGNKPINVNSWYRDPRAKKAVGGARESRHLKGDAVDFSVKGIHPHDVYGKLDSYWGNKGGLGKYNAFTHVDSRGKKVRW